MSLSQEQRIVLRMSMLVAGICAVCWLVLLCAGESIVQQIAEGTGPFAHVRRLAERLLAGIPADQFSSTLLGEFHKFATRLTTIYLVCQSVLLIGSLRSPNLFKDFFSAETHPVNLAILRIAFFLTLYPRVGLEGVKRFIQTPKDLWVAPPGLGWLIEIIPQSETFVTVVFGVFAVACFAGLIGMCTRTACLMATLSAFFLLGVPQFFGKINHYHHIIWVGAILSVSRCSDVLSVDAIWSALRGGLAIEKPKPSSIYSVPMRMILLFLGVIYFFPGFWKYVVSGPQWFLSDNLQARILLRMFVSDGWEPIVRVDQYPLLCKFGGFTTILMEMGFVFLIFSRWGRYVAAIGGLTFHFLVQQMMNISFWPIQVYYLAFADVHGLLKRVGAWICPNGITLNFAANNETGHRLTAIAQSLDLFDVVQYQPGKDEPSVVCNLSQRTRGSGSVGAVMLVGTIILVGNILCGFTMTDSWPFGVYPTFARIIPPVFQSLTMDAVDEEGRVLADVEIYYDPAIREVFPKNRLGEIVQQVSRAPDRSERLASIWNIWQKKHPEVSGANRVNFYVANYSCDPDDAERNPVDRKLMEVVALAPR